MKKIIICEGWNDKLFIENLLKELGFSDTDFKLFDIQKIGLSRRRYAERDAIRSFTEINPFNKRKFLIKLEGGKDFAIKVFCRELTTFLSYLDNSILIIDNDVGDISQKIASFKGVIEKYHSKTTPLRLTHQEKKKTQHLHHSSITVELEEGNKNLGDFQIIFFKKTLESSCCIKKEHTEEEKIKKIIEFIQSENIRDFFNPIISE